MRRTTVASLSLALPLALTAAVPGQTYRELTFVRARPQAAPNLLEVEAGGAWGFPEDKDPSIGLDDKVGFDGHVYYKHEKIGGRDTNLDAYFGRDGFYLGTVNQQIAGQGNLTRLELAGRLWPFYREGFYRGSDFIPTGRYEGRNYSASLSVGRQLQPGVQLEFGGFYRRNQLSRNRDTAASYTQPEDYDAYGGQAWFEQGTLAYSQRHSRPEGGYIMTLGVEREWNDSNGTIGVAGGWQSTLPSAIWRGRGRLEWYTTGESGTVVLKLDGSLSDSEDRVYNYDAQKPIGHTYVDLDLGFRFDFGESLFLTPAFKGEWVRILDEFGTSTKSKTFIGFGLRAELDLSNAATVIADYSYLGNESRPPVSISEDTFGEHQLFASLRLRFGGK